MAGRRKILAVDSQVAERIRIARKMRGLSQQRVGEVLGLTFQQVQKYEKGTNRISIGRLHAIATVIGVPMSFFLEGLDVNTSVTSSGIDMQAVNAALKTKEGLRVAAALSQVKNTSVRRHIADLLEAIIDAERESSPSVN
jgi:transcriptional regulator with XRE-family HTH domain